jgi:hypothetical protein
MREIWRFVWWLITFFETARRLGMSRSARICRPVVDGLEPRLAMSHSTMAASPGFPVIPGPPGAGTEQGALAVLESFSHAYLSHIGQTNYAPAFDLNHNGQIGQDDAKLLLRSLPPVSPKIPITITLAVAPQDRAKGHTPQNSGGATYAREPTIVGHTTPGALIFTGAGTLDWKLRDPVLVADSNGDFSLRFVQSNGINQLDFRAIDAYGQHVNRSFPMLWLGFAAYERAHPRNL